MAIITGGKIMPGYGPYLGTAFTNGTNAIQTITITNANGGNFALIYDGHRTSAIAWNATEATLVAAIDAALEALPNINNAGVTTANSTLNAGNGNVTVTFNGINTGKRVVTAITANYAAITGTNAVVSVCSTTTNGVNCVGQGALQGAQYIDKGNGLLYVNNGEDGAPTWAVQA